MDLVRKNVDRGYSNVDSVVQQLAGLIAARSEGSSGAIVGLSTDLLSLVEGERFATHSPLIIQSCAFLFDIGKSDFGILLGKELASRAEVLGNSPVRRKILNILGGQYCDVADFASAMSHLEAAVVLARALGDPTSEAACLANVIAVLQEMGHYRQAIAMAERVLRLSDESQAARTLKLQCTSNGLFAAHRIKDAGSAASFLARGQGYLCADTEPLRRAFFERARSLYLVDLGRFEQAKRFLADTAAAVEGIESARISTILSIASYVCDWAGGDKAGARHGLEALARSSKESRLYHHFVLQALTKVYSDSTSPADAERGMTHARELVEFTTSVKKAKFYRQLANKREESEHRVVSSLACTAIDPFNVVAEWLNASDILGPVAEQAGAPRRELTKHEELTAIHDDMAKLRVATLRREIRTDAVDTAENWAIAAEFFDDETGQHCYRVGHLASMLASGIGMDETFCIQVEHAARLHDIGKIAVNEVILLKPGPLDASEMAAMRLHTEVGAQILSGSDDPTLMMAVEVARHHHEWWNGAGYPAKLSGKNIPISARVSAYADVYDALTHARAYKKAWTHERALEEITRLVGTQFDPDLIAPFSKVLNRYRAALESNAIPGFRDMDSNTLIASRKKLMETISGPSH